MQRNFHLYNIPGLYKIEVHPLWQHRTFPQIIATIKVLRNLVKTRRKYDPLEECVYDAWARIRCYEYSRIMYVVSHPALVWCKKRLVEFVGLLDNENYFMPDTPEYRMRIVLVPNRNELQLVYNYWLGLHELHQNTRIQDFSYFLPECAIISLLSDPCEVAAIILARIFRGNYVSDYERIFLQSRIAEINIKKNFELKVKSNKHV